MKAVLLDERGVSVAADYPEPTLEADEVLVEVRKAGVCETDLQLVRGYMGFRGVLGHEFVGVAKTGPLTGRRVVGEINCHCRKCDYCRRGLGRHCPHRSVLGILNHDGAFAEKIAVPQGNLHVVPDSISDEEAVFVEPVAAAFEIPAQLKLTGREQVIVLGDGRLGNLCGQVLKSLGCAVLVVGKHAEKLAILRQLGLQTVRLDQLEVAKRADVVVDCTGSPDGLALALQLVKPRGTVVLKTTVAGDHRLSLAPIVIDEITLLGSRCGPFEPAIAALADGTVKVTPLIHACYPLEKAAAALDEAAAPGVFKVLLDPRSAIPYTSS